MARRAGIYDATSATAQSKKATVSAESQRGLGLVVTPLVVRQKTLTTGRYPFHWAADMLRGPQNQRMFCISEVLGPEAATDIWSDESHGRRRYSKGPGNMVAIDMDVLAGHIQRIPVMASIVDPDSPAWLHGVGDHTVVVDAKRDAVRRRGKRRIDCGSIACSPIEADIACDFGCNLRCAWRASGGRGRHRRQWGVVHNHPLGGVERFGSGLSNNERERLTDVADLVDG